MKLVTVSLGNACIKNPRCSFCYLKDQEERSYFHPKYYLENLFEKEPKFTMTICYEYCGLKILDMAPIEGHLDLIRNVTTMPQAINKVTVKHFKAIDIKHIALSYDSQKCPDIKIWTDAARIIRKYYDTLSCNYLIENSASFIIPPEIFAYCTQFNFLSLKSKDHTPRLMKDLLKMLHIIIFDLKAKYPKIDIVCDNCLAIQLGYDSKCHAGEDFVLLNADGKLEDCCFKDKCCYWTKNVGKVSLAKGEGVIDGL